MFLVINYTQYIEMELDHSMISIANPQARNRFICHLCVHHPMMSLGYPGDIPMNEAGSAAPGRCLPWQPGWVTPPHGSRCVGSGTLAAASGDGRLGRSIATGKAPEAAAVQRGEAHRSAQWCNAKVVDVGWCGVDGVGWLSFFAFHQ